MPIVCPVYSRLLDELSVSFRCFLFIHGWRFVIWSGALGKRVCRGLHYVTTIWPPQSYLFPCHSHANGHAINLMSPPISAITHEASLQNQILINNLKFTWRCSKPARKTLREQFRITIFRKCSITEQPPVWDFFFSRSTLLYNLQSLLELE